MGFGTGVAIYFVIWWVTLFITLPFNMRSQVEDGVVVDGTEAAAPSRPQLGRRMIVNTIFAGVVFALYWFVVHYIGFGLDDIPELIPIPKLER